MKLFNSPYIVMIALVGVLVAMTVPKLQRERTIIKAPDIMAMSNDAAYGETGARLRADADLQTIKKRIVDDLLAPAVNETNVRLLMQTMRPDGTWPDINYKDVSRTGFEHRIHL